jgi:hypothetical protein
MSQRNRYAIGDRLSAKLRPGTTCFPGLETIHMEALSVLSKSIKLINFWLKI